MGSAGAHVHGDVAVGCDTPTNASSVGARCIPFEVHAAKLADALMDIFHRSNIATDSTRIAPATS